MAFRSTLAGLLPALLLLLGACVGVPPEQNAWIEVRSPNFSILTDLDRDRALQLSEDVELFRAVLMKLTNATHFEPRVPTRIFAFGRGRDFHAFVVDRLIGGIFQPGLRENLVALDASGTKGVGAKTVLFHEYTHFVVHNQDQPPLPLWYDEGFAEFMGTVRIQEESVFIGAAPMYRRGTAAYGRQLPTDRVLRARGFEGWSDLDTSMFYLQSWRIVHYLMLGPGKEGAPVGERMARYIQAAERGEDEERAFQAAFGMTFAELQDEVSSYHESDMIPAMAVPRDRFAPDRGTEVRAVPPAEIGVRLGMLALALGQLDRAGDTFERVLAADPGSARAHAGLGDVCLGTDRADEAEEHYTRDLELAPDDFENHLERAESLHRLAETKGQLELLPRAREHYARAIALAPEIPEGHLMLGRTYLLGDGDPSPGIRAAERARELLPGHPAVQLTLAQLYMRAGQRAPALAAARRVAIWSQGEMKQEANALLAELGTSPPAPASK